MMKKNKDYGKRLLARGIWASNNTFETNMNNNDLIFGTSGCGKTGGYVAPMLQNPSESMVVVDAKGNLARMFSRPLIEKGFKVHLIDFVNPKRSTCGFNPLAYVGRDGRGGFCEKDLRSLAHALVPELDNSEPYWTSSARNYLTMLFAYVMVRLPVEQQNLRSVIEIHSVVCNDAKAFKTELDNVLDAMPEDCPPQDAFLRRTSQQIFGLLSSDRTWACVLDFATTALNTYDTADLQLVLSDKPTLDLSALGRERSVVFLNISDMDRTYDNILNLFYTQLFQKLEEEASRNPDGRLRVPVRIVMDDFASGSKMDEFDKIISVIRSRDIYVSLIIQSLSQLDSLYGEGKARTIINNCDHLLYMGGNDMSTLEFVASRVNRPTASVGRIPRDKMYLITVGERPRLVDKVPPYSRPEEEPRGDAGIEI